MLLPFPYLARAGDAESSNHSICAVTTFRRQDAFNQRRGVRAVEHIQLVLILLEYLREAEFFNGLSSIWRWVQRDVCRMRAVFRLFHVENAVGLCASWMRRPEAEEDVKEVLGSRDRIHNDVSKCSLIGQVLIEEKRKQVKQKTQ